MHPYAHHGRQIQNAQEKPESLVNSYSGLGVLLLDLYSLPTRRDGIVIDALDGRLIELFTAEPRIGVLEASRRLGVARGTAQARLDRLVRHGVIAGLGPEIDPAALGYGVTAFVTLEIRQVGGHDPVAERLMPIPEVIEVHTITGPGDMLCRVVARSNQDLQRVIDQIVDVAGVQRASSVISLATPVPHRTLPLVRAAAHAVPGAGGEANGPPSG